jgi:hypothetical protein
MTVPTSRPRSRPKIGAADSGDGDPHEHVGRGDDLRVGCVLVRELLDVSEGDGLQCVLGSFVVGAIT